MDKVVHFEIPADDPERAQNFYKKIFGWKINAVPGIPYFIINTVETDEKNMPKELGAINGGMMQRNAPDESPVIVVSVKSVEEYLKKIEKEGGKVVLPLQEVGGMGLYARICDTEGNIIGLWQDLGY